VLQKKEAREMMAVIEAGLREMAVPVA